MDGIISNLGLWFVISVSFLKSLPVSLSKGRKSHPLNFIRQWEEQSFHLPPLKKEENLPICKFLLKLAAEIDYRVQIVAGVILPGARTGLGCVVAK